MIVRSPREDRYTILNRTVVNDDRLSFRALGLLTFILDKPDDWHIESTELAKGEGREGRDAVRSALRELEAAGYLRRVKVRRDDGTFDMLSTVYDRPTTENPAPDRPATGADAGNPGTENPAPETPATSTKTVTDHCPEEASPVLPSVAAQRTPEPARRGDRAIAACRPRNEVFDALVEACGMAYDEMTAPARKRTAVAAAQLQRVGATPDEIMRRAEIYRQVHTASLTPTALSSQWAACRDVPAPVARGSTGMTADRLRALMAQRDAVVIDLPGVAL